MQLLLQRMAEGGDQRPVANDADAPAGVDSPHFRPVFADVTNDPFLLESPGFAAKKRKSLGRRVSFAAKAKVRYARVGLPLTSSFIEKESDEEEGGSGDRERERSKHRERERDEPEDVFTSHAVEPIAIASAVGAVPLPFPPVPLANAAGAVTDKEKEKEKQKDHGNDGDAPRSDADMSIISNESIEVEVRDHNASFHSYESDEDVDVDVSRPFVLDDMEMTNCVGGIISTAAGQHESSALEEHTMDFTACVGGMIESMPSYADVAGEHHPVSPSSVDTMELTTCIGGILVPLRPNQQLIASDDPDSPITVIPRHAGREPPSPSRPAVQEDMDMTAVVRDTIHDRPRRDPPPSPSPFLVLSPGRFTRFVDSPHHSEVSFIGDIAQPHGLGTLASPADAAPSQADQDLTAELFHRYSKHRCAACSPHPTVDTSRLQGLDTIPPPVATPIERATKALLSSPTPSESPTVTTLLPRASLKDFLHETGVRFLDNLSSLARRETSGRPRESELISAGKQLYVDCGLSLECDALDGACQQLSEMIAQVKGELARHEEQFNHSPPLAFLEYHREKQERANVTNKLRTLKSIARLYAKQAWYQWRHSVHAALNEKLQDNAVFIGKRVAQLCTMNNQLDQIIATLDPMVVRVTDEAESARERHRSMQNDDLEQAAQMEELVGSQNARLLSMDSEMASLVRREEELRVAIEATLRRRKELQQHVAALHQEIEAIPESSPVVLAELQSLLALQQATVGWSVTRASRTELCLQFTRTGLGASFKLAPADSGKTKAVSVDFDTCSVVQEHLPSHRHH